MIYDVTIEAVYPHGDPHRHVYSVRSESGDHAAVLGLAQAKKALAGATKLLVKGVHPGIEPVAVKGKAK